MAERIGVICVDDNDLLAGALERWLVHEPSINWLGWLPAGAGVEEAVERLRPRVVLMDVDIPGTDTFSLVQRLSTNPRDARVLMLSGHVRSDYIRRAVDAGAMGYLVKDEHPRDIAAAVLRVAGGEFVLSRTAETVLRRDEAYSQ